MTEDGTTQEAHKGNGALTRDDWLRERSLSEDEYGRGNLPAAILVLTNLLARIEALPEGTPLGRGSHEHCLTLAWLATCLGAVGQVLTAQQMLSDALVIINKLLKQEPDNQDFIRQHGALLVELGNVQLDQGQYPQAFLSFDDALAISKRLGDQHSRAVILAQMGTLALKQRDLPEAERRYTAAVKIDHELGDAAREAVSWYQLGIVAAARERWVEAVHCYRKGLALVEKLENVAAATATCNQLAIVTQLAGQPTEAEEWYKRALEFAERLDADNPALANVYSNLAALLLLEVRAERAPKARLDEAHGYAERALAIRETLSASEEIWTSLDILASIAALQGRVEEAGAYRRREREAFAAFAGNRYQIGEDFGPLIAATAAAAKGDSQARAQVAATLPELEANNWHVTAAVQRMWDGERDWHALVEDLGGPQALLVRMMLETIAPPVQVPEKTPEEVIAALPTAIREALKRGDEAAFQQAFEVLPPEEQRALVDAMHALQVQQGQEIVEEQGDLLATAVLQQFEPLLQAIAVVATGDATYRGAIEKALAVPEAKQFSDAVQHIWAGERNATTLTVTLDEQDTLLVHRVLEIIRTAHGQTHIN